MLPVFFDVEGVVDYEFLPREQAINAEFYLTVYKGLTDRVHRLPPNLTP